ncbi:MAG TPA: dTDP-4-dehydrorhamnose reductase [Acidobacteriota bacterium]|nr:dTDP-4-dehydrorhamnose reductase [Acidobacteriota bacterium]
MHVAIIGARGQLGHELVKVFGPNCAALDVGEVDIRDPAGLRKALAACRPDVVINAAAYHNVPDCEKDAARAFAVNAVGVKNLRDACLAAGLGLVQISTDYVFDGTKGTAYTEDDAPNPVNTYGVSKLAGEFFARQVPLHHVVRVSSLFGITGSVAKGGVNFVKLMLEAARTKDRVAVSSNIFSSPTYAVDAAVRIREMLEAGAPPGVYHVTNDGECSWHDLAAAVFDEIGAGIALEPRIETPELEGGLRRPLRTALRSLKAKPLRPWREALKDYLEEERAHDTVA